MDWRQSIMHAITAHGVDHGSFWDCKSEEQLLSTFAVLYRDPMPIADSTTATSFDFPASLEQFPSLRTLRICLVCAQNNKVTISWSKANARSNHNSKMPGHAPAQWVPLGVAIDSGLVGVKRLAVSARNILSDEAAALVQAGT